MRNQKGVITLDYLFAFVLVMGFTGIIFTVTMTLSVVEVTQYITFATARTYMASHKNIGRQQQLAFTKYKELAGNPVLAAFYNNGWFEISQVPDLGPLPARQQNLQPVKPSINYFVGAGTPLLAKMLDFRIPGYGSTTNSDTDDGFQTYVSSYLGREPTVQECLQMAANRWSLIQNLDGKYGEAENLTTGEPFIVMADNGC